MLDSFRHHLAFGFSEQHQNLGLGLFRHDNDLLEKNASCIQSFYESRLYLSLPRGKYSSKYIDRISGDNLQGDTLIMGQTKMNLANS